MAGTANIPTSCPALETVPTHCTSHSDTQSPLALSGSSASLPCGGEFTDCERQRSLCRHKVTVQLPCGPGMQVSRTVQITIEFGSETAHIYAKDEGLKAPFLADGGVARRGRPGRFR